MRHLLDDQRKNMEKQLSFNLCPTFDEALAGCEMHHGKHQIFW